jgi:hypothetical protein
LAYLYLSIAARLIVLLILSQAKLMHWIQKKTRTAKERRRIDYLFLFNGREKKRDEERKR